MHWKLILLFTLLMLAYAALGGVAFHFIESNYEAALGPSTQQRLLAYMGSRSCLSLDALMSLKALLARLPQGGLIVDPRSGELVNATNWDIPSGIFLSSQIIGAVGYGTVSPRTVGGKVFLVFYTCLGLPLFIVLAFGLSRPIARLVRSFEARCCPLHADVTGGAGNQSQVAAGGAAPSPWFPRVVGTLLLRIFALFVVGSVFFVLVPAAIFNALETWTYAECIYFSYVSVLSIGFGDYIPGNGVDQSYRGWYRLGTAFYLYISVAFFVVVFAPFKEALDFRIDINKPLDLHEPEPIIFQALPRPPGFHHRHGSHRDKSPAARPTPAAHSGYISPPAADNHAYQQEQYDQYQRSLYPSMPSVNQPLGNLTRLSVNM